MGFLKSISSSVYGPDYYRALDAKPLSHSIRYFFALIACLAVIASAIFLFSVIPAVHALLVGTSSQIVASYPDQLTITVASGTASVNAPEPYFLPLPPALQADVSRAYGTPSASAPAPQNLLTVDTKDPFTVDEFQNDRTLLLLTSDSVAYARDEQGQDIVIQPLSTSTSFIIDKSSVASFANKAQPYFKFVEWAIGILMPIGIFVAFAFRLVYLFLLALLIWGIALASHINMPYKKAYQRGIHLMTLPLLATTALWLILPGFGIPFLFTILALIMAAVNLRSASVPAVSVPSSHEP